MQKFKKKSEKQKVEEAEVAKSKKNRSKAEEDKDAMAFVASVEKAGNIGNIKKKIDFISTGSWVLNRLIGDGTLQDKPGGIMCTVFQNNKNT